MNSCKISIIIILNLCLIACKPNISTSSYSVGSVGQVNRTISAVVISVRNVEVSNTTAVGGGAGALGGAIAGSNIGGSDAAGILGAIGGAIVGGIIGDSIEETSSRQPAIEYIVETSNGSLLTIVQGDDPVFNINQKVFVIYGSRSRLIADTRELD